jgi:hypothetical protein
MVIVHLMLQEILRLSEGACVLLPFHQQLGLPVAFHVHQHLVLSVILILVILVNVEWYLIVICISLLTDDVDLFYMPIGPWYIFFNSKLFTIVLK